MSKIKTSVIITTYNWPAALEAVLKGFSAQTEKSFEVIIADDGSTAETAECIKRLKPNLPFNLEHSWQKDEGFRAAAARNKAAAISNGNYLIFIDGDSIPLPSFVERHIYFSKTGKFIAGNRILLSEKFSSIILNQNIPVHLFKLREWLSLRMQRKVNRIMPFFYLKNFYLRNLLKKEWKGVRTCNFSCWKNDFFNVNGFDEKFVGWGREDSDLAIRLINSGIYRKDGRFALPVLHLWHKEFDRANFEKNDKYLLEAIKSKKIKAEEGVNRYLL
ncbi:MAG: glycosyltransferase family 2 protein [Spirochaetia bacterium]|nr:glycosyltransferase family 2 protein [Spirochaetia bacterium]